MGQFRRISISQTWDLINHEGIELVDIRDPHAYAGGRIAGARHLDNSTLPDFLEATPRDRVVVVYCYHGHSSQGAAAFLNEQGFAEVYSMDGGFELWRLQYPVDA
jgi:thiosulfate sulfurtransferase